MRSLSPILKLVIAVLLLLCLADMPYGYYNLVRIAASGYFAYLAYDYFKANKDGLGFVFAALALLFQPFIKIALGRVLWNSVDVIVAIWLIFLTFKVLKNK